MSHTSTVTDIEITDLDAAQAAVEELAGQGVKVSFHRNSTPRAYSSGQMGEADAVIKLDDQRYDVGLYKQSDGTYAVKTDFYTGAVEKVLGVPGDHSNQGKLGKFFQMYSVNAAMRNYTSQGCMVERSMNQNGEIQLVVTGNFA